MISWKMPLKKAISDFLVAVGSPVAGAGQGFRILTYHSITDRPVKNEYDQMTTPKDLFDEQMNFLEKNGYNVISPREIIDHFLQKKYMPAKTLGITFDDGFKDNLRNALPVLKKYGYKAALFLTVNFIGEDDRYLDWDDIRMLAKTDIFCFGSHTCGHRKLSALKRDDIDKEIGLSKSILEDKTNREIFLFAYPFGSYGSFNRIVKDALKRKGYNAAFTTIAGLNTSTTDPFEIRRTRISWFDNDAEFVKELKGAYDWYRVWQRMSGTL